MFFFKVHISVDNGFTCVRPLLHVRVTLSNQLKIAQQQKIWVYYMYALPMIYRKGVRFAQ